MPCFGGRSPTVEAETHLSGSCSHVNSETWDGDLSCSRLSERLPSLLSRDKTSQSVADIDKPENVQSHADGMQPAPSALQLCWNKVKNPLAGRSKRRSQQVNKRATRSPAAGALGAVEVAAADKSVLAMAPAADKDQQVLIRAVTATAVPGSPSELQVQGLQQQQQAISNSGQGLSSHKGQVEMEELLTDHKAADVKEHGSNAKQLHQPVDGQTAESIR